MHEIYRIVILLAALQASFYLCAFGSDEAQQETYQQPHEKPPNLPGELKQKPAANRPNQQHLQQRQRLENKRIFDNSATKSSAPCREDREFHCKLEDRCIPIEWRCDFREQCLDGQDELNCPPEWCDFDHNLCHWLNDLARNNIETKRHDDDDDDDRHHHHVHQAESNDNKNDDNKHPDRGQQLSGDLVGRGIWRRYLPTEYRGNILITRVLQKLMTLAGPHSVEDHSQHDRLGKFAFVPMILDNRKGPNRSLAIISSPLIGQTNSACQLRFKYSLFANQTTSAPLTPPTTSFNNTSSLVFKTSLTLRAKTSDGRLSTVWSRTLEFNRATAAEASGQPNWLVGVAELGHLSQAELSFAAESQIINNNELVVVGQEEERQEAVQSYVAKGSKLSSSSSSSPTDSTPKNILYQLNNIYRVGYNGDKVRDHPKTARKREQRQHGFAIIALRWLKFHDCRWPRASIGRQAVRLNGPLALPGPHNAHDPQLGQLPRLETPQPPGTASGGLVDDESQADNNNNRRHQTREEANKLDNNPLDLQSFREHSDGEPGNSNNNNNNNDDDDDDYDFNSNSDDEYNWLGTSGRQNDRRHCFGGGGSGSGGSGDNYDDDSDEDYYDKDYCSNVIDSNELVEDRQLVGQGQCLKDEFECVSNGICLARWKLCNLVNNCMSFNGDGLAEDEAHNLCRTVPGMETFDGQTVVDKKIPVGYHNHHQHYLNVSQFWSLDPGNWPRDMIRVVKSSPNTSQPFLPSQDHSSKQTLQKTTASQRMDGKFLSFLVVPEEVNYGKLTNIIIQNKQTIQWASIESPPMQKLAHDECRLKFFYNVVDSSNHLNQQLLPFKIILAVEHLTLGNINAASNSRHETKRQSTETRPKLDALLHSHQIDIDRLMLDGQQSTIEYPGVDFWREFNQPLVGLDEGDIFLVRLTLYVESSGDKLQARQILTRTQEEIHSKATINIDDISLHFGCGILAEEPSPASQQDSKRGVALANMLTAFEQAKNADYSIGPKRFFRPEKSNSTMPIIDLPQRPPLPLINRRRNKWNYNYRHSPDNNNTSSETTSTTINNNNNNNNYSGMSQVEPQKLILYLFGVVCSIVGLIAIIVFVLVPYVERVMMSYEEQIQLGLGSEISDVPIQDGDFGPSGGPSGGDMVNFGESISPLDALARYQQQKQWRLIGSQADSGCYHQHRHHHQHQQRHQELPRAPGSCVDTINASGAANSSSFSSSSSSSLPSSPTCMAAAFVDSEMYHHKLEFIRSRMASNSSNSLANLHQQTSSFATNNNNNSSSLNSFNGKTTSEL